jgi:hypothetical protein
MSGAILRPRSLMCRAHCAHCVLVSLAPRPSQLDDASAVQLKSFERRGRVG